jgi:23S rRNA (uridine2552-2'-O)-methyltransferase
VIDLGVAPGGWSQVVRKASPAAAVVGIDLLPTDPLDGVTLIQMDFTDESAPGGCAMRWAGRPTSSCPTWPPTRSATRRPTTFAPWRWSRRGSTFATEVLRPGGAYVAKVLAGGADNDLVAALKRNFATVKHAKPPASRKESSEWYVVAQGFKGGVATAN